MQMKRTLKTAVASGAVAIALLVPMSSVASADETSNTSNVRARLTAVCTRTTTATTRTQTALDRLQGDASTKGSLAWMQAKIDQATEAGRTQMVTALQNRLEVRTARVAVLTQKLATLGEISEFCASHQDA